MAVLHCLLLLFIIVYDTLSIPQYSGANEDKLKEIWEKSVNKGYDCVPFALCIDGVITQSGEGLIDLRIQPALPADGPYKSCGAIGNICCQIPPDFLPKVPTYPECTGVEDICVEHHECNTYTGILLNLSPIVPGTTQPLLDLTRCSAPGFPEGVCCRNLPPSFIPVAEQCQIGSDCVPYFQCDDDGYIVTDGTGLIDVRVLPSSKCTNPEYPDVPGICCLIPGFAPSFSPTIPPPVLEKCPASQVCVEKFHCKADGTVNTDGTELLDIREKTASCVLSPGRNGICCDVTLPAPIRNCPDSYSCVLPNQCSSGSISSCVIGGNTQGVCCSATETKDPIPDQCGIRNFGNSGLYTKISDKLAVNEAHFGEFPWQALIFFNNFTYRCGASLIGERHVLTAAHCVHDLLPEQINVRLGDWQVNAFDEPLPYLDVGVKEVYFHSYFNPQNLHNDIAVVELIKPVPFQYHINKVCIPSSSVPLFPYGTRCIATGWGKDTFLGNYQHKLKKVDLPTVDQSKCQELLQKTRLGKYFNLHESFICAGAEENKDACTGDGGGPLVCQDQSTGGYVLTGITAWGINCGQKDIPGVYVSVGHFVSWIQDVLYGNIVDRVTETSGKERGTCTGEQKCKLHQQCISEHQATVYGKGTVDVTVFGDSCALQEYPQEYSVCCSPVHTVEVATIKDSFSTADRCGIRNDFGKSGSATRIQAASPNEAAFGEFPWQAIIFHKNYTFKCGATIISQRHLLTAAHCVNTLHSEDVQVRVGEWQVNSFEEPLPYKDYKVSRIVIHEALRAATAWNDIALIEVVSPIELSYHINAVCRPPKGLRFPGGTRCVASGWGRDAFNGKYQHVMKRIDLPVVEKDLCQKLLRNTRLGNYFVLHSSFMCAGGEENKDACKGDGGGPLACQDNATGQYYLVGITAWGIGCGTKDIPGVYVDVAEFDDWINRAVGGGGLGASYP